MRRPNRSIEVFDISLMAVVTKAMGAFLVLMVVFMQYYSSGPLGRQTAADIQQSIEQTQKDLTEAMKKLVQNSSPDEVAKLLEEARRRLDEAKRLIEQLRRENDALNSQAQRLQQENEQLQKQVEDTQRQLDGQKTVVAGSLVNWDCMDVRLQLAIVSTDMYINRDKNQKDPYVLNSGVSLGASDATDEGDFRQANPNSTSQPGEGSRFNNSAFRFATDPATYSIIAVKQRIKPQNIRGTQGRALQRSKEDCTALVSINVSSPKGGLFGEFTRRVFLPKDDYATPLFDAVVGGKDNRLRLVDTPAATKAWLADQVAHAEKVP